MIGIVVALKPELNNLLNFASNIKEQNISGKTFITCKIANKDVCIAISNVGKVASAMTTQILIDKFSPKIIINFGSVGGLKEKVNALNLYSVEKCCQYDFDLSELDKCPIGFNQNYDSLYIELDKRNFDLERVKLATSDRFTCKESDISLINTVGADIYDMEGCAIAQVCLSNKIKLIMIKGVTDVYGSGIVSEQFIKNLNKVGELLSSKILEIIEKL